MLQTKLEFRTKNLINLWDRKRHLLLKRTIFRWKLFRRSTVYSKWSRFARWRFLIERDFVEIPTRLSVSLKQFFIEKNQTNEGSLNLWKVVNLRSWLFSICWNTILLFVQNLNFNCLKAVRTKSIHRRYQLHMCRSKFIYTVNEELAN